MTVPPLLELVRRTSERIAEDYDLDPGLTAVVTAIHDAGGPSEAVDAANSVLRERTRAARAAVEEVEELRRKVKHLARLLQFSEEGWAERKAQLERHLAQDPVAGLGAWLDDWFTAIAQGRLAAAERLLGVDQLPPGAALLVERCSTAAAGLGERWWHVASPVLAAGAAGIPIGDEVVPSGETRYLLRLMLARLALYGGRYDEAEELLETARTEGDSPALNALQARLCRLRGDSERALRHLNEATRYGAADLDAAIESIAWANEKDRLEIGLDAARMAVTELLLLSDIDEQVVRLVAEPPAEVWIAVGERALREHEFDLFDRALQSAWDAGPYDAWPLQAVIAELRVEGTRRRGAPVEQQVDALIKAGEARLDAEQLDLAAQHYGRAHELSPDNAEAAVKLADCLIALNANEPLARARAVMEHGLELLLDVQKRGAIDPDHAWSYLSEASARERLADVPGIDVSDHLWRALLATCKALAYDPDATARWVELSGAADAVGLPRMAMAASGRALALDPDDEAVIAQHILTLANIGRLDDALLLLQGRTDAWDSAARAYVYSRKADPYEAVRILRATDLDPSWSWARLTLIFSLINTGRFPEAVAAAEDVLAFWETRLDEEPGLWPSAWALLTLGRFEEGERLARQLVRRNDSGEEALPIGVALLLRKDATRGLDAIQDAVRLMRTTRELDEWGTLFEPYLRALASRYELRLPPLTSVHEAVERCRGALETLGGPTAEVARPPVEARDAAVGCAAKAFASAFAHLADDQPGKALAALEAPDAAERGEPEMSRLRDHLRLLQARAEAPPVETAQPAELAEQVLAAARAGDDVRAIVTLRRLVDESLATASSLLMAAAATDLDVLTELDRLLVELGESPGYESAVLTLRDDLLQSGLQYSPVPEPLQVAMPAQWFEDHVDPINDHPLFLRYLPEMRLRERTPLPPIQVGAEVSLDPDRYQVFALGEMVDESRADPASLYAAPEALRFLGPTLTEAAERDEDSGLMRIPESAADDPGGLRGLLTMPAIEVATRRIAVMADREAERLAEAPAQPSELPASNPP
jgi:tetratricopeptide (TPR) repeat protein